MSISGRIVPTARREPELHSGGLPLLGRLKVGMKVKNAKGREYPTSLDYFKANGKYSAVFHQCFGEKPNKVQIMFFSNEPKEVCSERFVVRDNAGRLLAEGDGEWWRVWSTKAAEYRFVPKQGEPPVTLDDIEKAYCNDAQKGKLSIELTLSFIILKIPSVLGQWQLSTRGSKSSIPAIRSTFDRVKEMAGFVTNIPFDLLVEKVKSNKPGEASVFPVISLVPNVSQENIELLADFVGAGKKIRGLLTEAKIRALVGEVVEDDAPSTTPAIAAQVVPDRLSLPASTEEQDDSYGGTEDETIDGTREPVGPVAGSKTGGRDEDPERDTQTMELPLDDETNDGVDGDTEEKE